MALAGIKQSAVKVDNNIYTDCLREEVGDKVVTMGIMWPCLSLSQYQIMIVAVKDSFHHVKQDCF